MGDTADRTAAHLPLGADSDIAVALAGRLAAARPDMLVAPLLPYGSAGEHADFPGTLSIGAAALELVVVELVRSAGASADEGERLLDQLAADLVASVDAWSG